MTFVIAGPCIDVKDKSCAEVCPVDCIHVEADDRMCYIDPAACINCGVCVEACPVAAISDENDLTAETAPFLRVNAVWFTDRRAARAAVNHLKSTGFSAYGKDPFKLGRPKAAPGVRGGRSVGEG